MFGHLLTRCYIALWAVEQKGGVYWSGRSGWLRLGTGHATKSDEFSEKFRTAFDPPPLIFGKSCCKLFIIDMVANKELIEQIWSNYSIKDNRRISLELTFLKWRTMAWNGAAAVSARKRITSGRYWQELQLYKQAIDNHNFLSADLDRAMPGKPI